MYAIIERQKIFFEKGPPNLVPLKMDEVAKMIDMHISTVSRVSSSKYAQTPHGIYELRYFFTSEVKKSDDAAGDGDAVAGDGAAGVDVTAERVKDRLRQLIDDEDPKAPITDQRIAEVLGQENLPVARRTVAKYREQMKIPSARMRQKYE
jgi:RNA polymerase sigma-54 factor